MGWPNIRKNMFIWYRYILGKTKLGDGVTKLVFLGEVGNISQWYDINGCMIWVFGVLC